MSTLADILGCLASGARIVLVDAGEGYTTPELRMPAPRLDGTTWDTLCRDGWLESMPNGGAFKLSDAGLLSYLHSTDELGDGKLINPRDVVKPSTDPLPNPGGEGR